MFPAAREFDLPIHPRTGLRALAIGKRGPIWPILGGSSDATPNNMPGAGQSAQPPAAGETPPGAPPWGDNPADFDPEKAARLIDNLRASEDRSKGLLAAQRAELDTLKSQLAEAAPTLQAADEARRKEQGELATVREDLQRLQEQLTQAQEAAKANLDTALRSKVAELASNKQFINSGTASKLIDLADCIADGQINEEAIASKLDALAQSDPYLVATTAGSGHRPNPAQGQGGGPAPLDAQIAAAEKRGDILASIALKQQKLYQTK